MTAARSVMADTPTARADAEAFAAAVAQRTSVPSRIVSESRGATASTVEAEVAVSAAQLTELLRRVSCSSYRAVVALPETIDGRPRDVRTVETAAVAALVERHLRVFDWEFASRQSRSAALVRLAVGGDRAAALQIGTRFVANLVVMGRADARFSQDNEGIVSYRATANVRVIQSDTGQVLWADEITEKGFGRDRAQAAREALDALAVATASRVVAGILGRLAPQRFTVMAEGSQVDADGLAAYLTSLPGVVSVEPVEGATGVHLTVTSRDKAGAVASALAGSGRYDVIGVGAPR